MAILGGCLDHTYRFLDVLCNILLNGKLSHCLLSWWHVSAISFKYENSILLHTDVDGLLLHIFGLTIVNVPPYRILSPTMRGCLTMSADLICAVARGGIC